MPLRAAALLHLDKDAHDRARGGRQGVPSCAYGVHADLTRQSAELVLQQTNGREFARRLSLGGALRAHETACFLAARDWARQGLEAFPQDGLLQLVFGAATEMLAFLAPQAPFYDNPTLAETKRVAAIASQQRQLWGEAGSAFAAAQSDATVRDEAELRRGHVLLRVGQHAQARIALERVVATNGDAAFVHLARLFLGRVHEDGGRPGDAEAEYRAALALHPDSQTAAVALSHLLWKTGQPEARVVLERALQRAEERGRSDPYWEYLSIRSARAEPIFAALRSELRP